jgi:hypothetical protein
VCTSTGCRFSERSTSSATPGKLNWRSTTRCFSERYVFGDAWQAKLGIDPALLLRALNVFGDAWQAELGIDPVSATRGKLS